MNLAHIFALSPIKASVASGMLSALRTLAARPTRQLVVRTVTTEPGEAPKGIATTGVFVCLYSKLLLFCRK